MRRLFAVAGFFTLVASCGFDPQPKDGKLPCDNGCPSGYVCRSDNRCWHANAPIAVDSGADVPAVVKDGPAAELAAADGPGSADGASPQADSRVAVDVGVAVDLAQPDTGTIADNTQVDTAGSSTVDVAMGSGGASGGTGGAVGSGGASGTGGAVASGGAVGSGGTSGTGGAVGSGGAIGTGGTAGSGGSTPDAAPDIPASPPDAACIPETDQQMCVRLSKNCGAVSEFDNCGHSRSIVTCGSCAATYLVCGTFAANVCPTVCIFDTSTFDNCVFGE